MNKFQLRDLEIVGSKTSVNHLITWDLRFLSFYLSRQSSQNWL